MDNKGSFHISTIILYTLAVFVLILGLTGGISLIASSGRLHNLLLPFQLMGLDMVANLLAPMLKSFLSGVGIFAIFISSALSLMLFAIGHLLGRISALEARLARLEG